MKKNTFCALALFALIANFSPNKATQFEIAPPLSAPQVGEKLIYNVYWMGAHIGIGTLEVQEKVERQGRQAYHLVATAGTNAFLSKLYPVHDEIHSFMDAETFHSLEFNKTLSEGKYRADERIIYDWKEKKGFYESLWNKSKKEFPLERPTHDLLSAFYWFRLQPAKVGDKIHTIVNSEEKNWDLELEVQTQEPRELRNGQSFNTFKVEPKTRLKGILYVRGRAWVYFSTDPQRTPVWITLSTPFGPVTGVLAQETS
ncbi:MAG: DUF3108 domain-containing protein [Candidatus Omnitrophica bacterium]|nr:DUF3108 domain-containing protein [Candidatus Omnitrophota bacterium]